MVNNNPLDQYQIGDNAQGVQFGNYNTQINDFKIIQQSTDYQTLKQVVDKARRNIEKLPDDSDFIAELQQAEKNLENFTRDILKLVEEINKIPLNSERGKRAKLYFEQGDYQAVREILDAKEMRQEKQALLKKKEQAKKLDEEASAQLNDLAEEYILKARLFALHYQLGDQRIPQTRQLFEEALEIGRTPERLFAYAYFLQINNQFIDTEALYQEALTIFRELAIANPAVYLYHAAATLINLGNLVQADSIRRYEAEKNYQEALRIARNLVKGDPDAYLYHVAVILDSLGSSFLNWQQPKKALPYLQEATELLTLLADQAPLVFGENLNSTKQLLQQAMKQRNGNV